MLCPDIRTYSISSERKTELMNSVIEFYSSRTGRLKTSFSTLNCEQTKNCFKRPKLEIIYYRQGPIEMLVSSTFVSQIIENRNIGNFVTRL